MSKNQVSPHMLDLSWPVYAYVRVPAAPLYQRPDDSQHDEEARYNYFLRCQRVKVEGYYRPPVQPRSWP